MVIVQGVFHVEVGDRERYLAESFETQRISRGEPGCLEYVVAGDPLDPERVVLSERWASRAELDAHLTALTARRAEAAAAGAAPLTPVTRELHFFEAAPIEVL